MLLCGDIVVGEIFIVLFVVVIVIIFIIMFVLYSIDFLRVLIVVVQFFKLIDIVFKIDFFDEFGDQFDGVEGFVELEYVLFVYFLRFKIKVLDDFIFIILVGKVIVFVGVSGLGKSIIVGFLEWWYNLFFGFIKFDGWFIEQFNFYWFCKNIWLVQ